MRKEFALLFIIILTSCSKKNTDSAPYIGGHYKTVSIKSDIAADLNNDGIKSTDIYFEVSGPHKTTDGSTVHFFDFTSYYSFVEMRPLPDSRNNAKMVAFNFPSQQIGFLGTAIPFLMWYDETFITYSYEFEKNGTSIKLINNNTSFDEKGKLINLQLLEDKKLKLELSKTVFDFVDKDWIEINITVIYKQVD
jgi:hypothetical protein